MKNKLIFVFCVIFIFLFFGVAKSIGESDVIINEIGATEPSGYEWLEIYNRGSSEVDMTGYKFFEENTNHSLVLKQGSFVLKSGEFALIAQDDVKLKQKYPNIFSTIFDSSWGSLNESGESIGFKDASGNFLEQFVYPSSINYSLERIDPKSDDFTVLNWREHESGNTIGQMNFASVVSPEVVSSTDVLTLEEESSTSTNVQIQNEVLILPEIFSTGTVFESTTTSTQIVEDVLLEQNTLLEAPLLEVSTNTEKFPVLVTINEFLPDPNDGGKEWIELYNDSSSGVVLENWSIEDATGKIASVSTTLDAKSFFVLELSSSKLNNGGDSLYLKNVDGVIVDEVHYDEGILLPSNGNSLARRIDGFDSNLDSEDFVETTTVTKGQKNILTIPYVLPIQNIASSVHSIKTPEVPVAKTVTTSTVKTSTPTKKTIASTKEKLPEFDPKKIIVDPSIQNFVCFSEIYPAPKKGEDEFIELFNNSSSTFDLSYFQLDDVEGGSKPFVFVSGTIILPQQFLVIPKKLSHVSLNNTEDSVRILFPNGDVMEEVVYDDVIKEQSYVKTENDEWVWTSEVTLGEPNQIVELEEVETKKSVSSSKQKVPVATTIENLDDFQSGDMVRIKGNVVAPPGVFGSQVFYVSDGRAVQIYMSKKDFPVFVLGDEVEVTGTLGASAGETRIKVKIKKDMRVKQKNQSLKPETIQLSSLDESLQGKLAMVSGEVTEKKSTYWFVDDGNGEIQVSFKKGANIDAQKIRVGDKVELTGLILNSKSTMQLFPRSQKDVVVTQNVSSTQVTANISPENSRKNISVAILGALGSLLFGFLVKIYGNKIVSSVKLISIRRKQKKNLG